MSSSFHVRLARLFACMSCICDSVSSSPSFPILPVSLFSCPLPAYPPCLSFLLVLPICDFLCECRPPFLSFLSVWAPACLPCLSCICYFLSICRPFLSFLSACLPACPAFPIFYYMSHDLPVLFEGQLGLSIIMHASLHACLLFDNFFVTETACLCQAMMPV